jgi:hypothetical protein
MALPHELDYLLLAQKVFANQCRIIFRSSAESTVAAFDSRNISMFRWRLCNETTSMSWWGVGLDGANEAKLLPMQLDPEPIPANCNSG